MTEVEKTSIERTRGLKEINKNWPTQRRELFFKGVTTSEQDKQGTAKINKFYLWT